MNLRYRVDLDQPERDELTAMLAGGKQPARKLKRAQILLAVDAGLGDEAIAATVVVGGSTVYRTKRRFVEMGLSTRSLADRDDAAQTGCRRCRLHLSAAGGGFRTGARARLSPARSVRRRNRSIDQGGRSTRRTGHRHRRSRADRRPPARSFRTPHSRHRGQGASSLRRRRGSSGQCLPSLQISRFI